MADQMHRQLQDSCRGQDPFKGSVPVASDSAIQPKASRLPIRFLLLLAIVALLAQVGLSITAFFFLKGRLPAARDPVLIEVVATHPGASAEEVERQVAIPLEITLAGMRRLKVVRSLSNPGRASVLAEFEPGMSYEGARHEVLDRLATISLPLPQGVTPQISCADSSPATLRYILLTPRDRQGREIYTLNDLRALQDWVLEREFRTVPRIIDVASFGGTSRRYEVQPDPDRLRRYGISLAQLEQAVNDSNQLIGGDYIKQGQIALTVRGVGLFGNGKDPFVKALGMKDPVAAAAHLRVEEQRRLREIRQLVIATVNNVGVRVEDIVEGGRLLPGMAKGDKGFVIAAQPRAGQVGISRSRTDAEGHAIRDADAWDDRDDCVEGVVYLRPGEDELAAWRDVHSKINELNNPGSGRLLPGVRLEPYLEGGGPPDHFWLRASLPINVSRERAASLARQARAVLRSYPEVERVVSEVGGPDDGTFPVGFGNCRFCVTLRPAKESPAGAGHQRPRTKTELMDAISNDLERKQEGIGWDFAEQMREGLWGEFNAGADEVLLKIIGPDLDELERLVAQAKPRLLEVAGVRSVRILPIKGLARLEFVVDREKCARWGVSVADVNYVLATALGGKKMSSMVEGEKTFDIVVRWPQHFRQNEQSILDIPVDVVNNQVVGKPAAEAAPPAVLASPNAANPITNTPRLRLRDLVTPLGEDGMPDAKGNFTRVGAAAIYREQGQRLILLRVAVRDHGPAAVRAECAKKIAPLLKAGYRLAHRE
jgi:Cu/Ag efflux pump CusA